MTWCKCNRPSSLVLSKWKPELCQDCSHKFYIKNYKPKKKIFLFRPNVKLGALLSKPVYALSWPCAPPPLDHGTVRVHTPWGTTNPAHRNNSGFTILLHVFNFIDLGHWSSRPGVIFSQAGVLPHANLERKGNTRADWMDPWTSS